MSRPTHTPDGVTILTWKESCTQERSPVRGRIGYPSDEITGWVSGPDEWEGVAQDVQGRTWDYRSLDGVKWEPVACS